MKSPSDRFLPWTARVGLVLLAVGLWSCTTEPISGITDFEFEFEEFEEIPDIEVELDTAAVEIEYSPVEEDTTYLQQQNVFLENAQTAAEGGAVSEDVLQVATEVEEAFDEETEAELGALAEEAEADPEAFAASLAEALEDPTSEQAQFVAQVEAAAAQQQLLAALLGVPPTTGGASGRMTDAAPALPTPRLEAPPSDVQEPLLDLMGCSEDAQAALQRALDRLQSRRDEQLAAVDALYEADLAKVAAFEAAQLADLEQRQLRRRDEAIGYWRKLRELITKMRDDGAIDARTEASFRLVNLITLTGRLTRVAEFARTTRRQIAQTVEQSLQAAEDRRDEKRSEVEAAFERARERAIEVLNQALQSCHDQGEAQG